MDEKLKRRLAGAAVLLLIAFVFVSLLPTPQEAARQVDGEVVTIALRDDVINEPGQVVRDARPAAESLSDSAPSEVPPASSGRDQAGDIDAASGDDDGVGETPPPSRPPAAAPAQKPEVVKPVPAKPTPTPVEAGKPVAQAEPPKAEPPKPEPSKPQTPPKAATAAVPVKPMEAPKPVEPAKPATTVAAPAAAPSKPAVGGGNWYVQIGGFADIGNARQAQDKVKAAGQGSVLAPIETAKGTLYRVRAGPYASREAAQAAQATLAGKGFPDAKLVAP